MRLKVLLPTMILVDETVGKVVAEGADGSFCLLPHHVDFVAALVPGLLAFETRDEEEVFLAVDEGVLVKCGEDVRVSTRRGIRGTDLETLEETVEQRFKTLSERERSVRAAMMKIEAGFVRRFLEIQHYGPG